MHEGEVSIGAKTVMGQECTISAYQHVSIGRECIIADRVMLIDFDHGVVEVERPIRLQGIYKRDVRVGHNVWIGYGACILRGVDRRRQQRSSAPAPWSPATCPRTPSSAACRRGSSGCARRPRGCAGSEPPLLQICGKYAAILLQLRLCHRSHQCPQPLIREAVYLHEIAQLSDADIARATGVERSPARHGSRIHGLRRVSGPSAIELSALVERLARVMEPSYIAVWLRKPVPALAERKPIDVIADRDYMRVAELVSTLEEASFS